MSPRVPLVVASSLALALSACATRSAPPPLLCAVVGGVVGGTIGAVAVHNQNENEDDQTAVGGGIGAVGGGLIAWEICRKNQAEPQAPQVRVSANPSSGEAPLRVDFRSTASDPDGEITGTTWDFGDGNTASGASATHTYQTPGTYTARATVTDNAGLRTSSDVSVRVTAQPPPPPPAPVRRIVLRGVNFDFDSAAIRPDAQVILDAALEQLQANPGVRVRITGHTDSTGPEQYNQGLSEQRARAVLDYFVSKGLGRDRFDATGAGEGSPVADNATRDGRAQNRRVELEVQQ